MDLIARAHIKDLNAIRELNSLLRIVEVKDFYWDTPRYVRSAILEARCFVVKGENLIKGAMILENRSPHNEHASESLAVGTLAIRPEFRRKGIGIRLVELAKALASRQNKRLYAESFLEFGKQGFYKNLGFKQGDQETYNGRSYHVFFLDPRGIETPS
jgi:GNAT superfamily N-acetyltransferase